MYRRSKEHERRRAGGLAQNVKNSLERICNARRHNVPAAENDCDEWHGEDQHRAKEEAPNFVDGLDQTAAHIETADSFLQECNTKPWVSLQLLTVASEARMRSAYSFILERSFVLKVSSSCQSKSHTHLQFHNLPRFRRSFEFFDSHSQQR